MSKNHLNARDIWGKVILYLKEKRLTSLYVASGDITESEIEGEHFIVLTDKDFLVDMLGRNKKDLQSALNWQGLELEFEVRKKEKQKSKTEEDLEKLKGMEEYLRIKK